MYYLEIEDLLYTKRTADASAGGVDSPNVTGASASPSDTDAFFAPTGFYGVRCWEAARLAGTCARSVNPASPAALCLTAEQAVSNCTGVSL